MSSENCIILFAKYPESRYCKTRIAVHTGERAALSIYRAMLSDMVQTFRKTGIDIVSVVSYHSPDYTGLPLQPDLFPVIVQRGDNIGIRMFNALRDVLGMGYKRAILTGSDIPGISSSLLQEGFRKLQTAELVLGPSEDGGYYAVGTTEEAVKRIEPVLTEIDWKAESAVFSSSVNKAVNKSITVDSMEVCNDIDTIADLRNYCLSTENKQSSSLRTWLNNNREVLHG